MFFWKLPVQIYLSISTVCILPKVQDHSMCKKSVLTLFLIFTSTVSTFPLNTLQNWISLNQCCWLVYLHFLHHTLRRIFVQSLTNCCEGLPKEFLNFWGILQILQGFEGHPKTATRFWSFFFLTNNYSLVVSISAGFLKIFSWSRVCILQ